MDDEYAALSAFSGLFAGKADAALGVDHFRSKMRKHAWDLTVERLAEWKMEALRMGVPESALDINDYDLAVMPVLLQQGKKLQQRIDKITGHDHGL